MPYTTPLKTRAGTPVKYDSGDFPKCQEHGPACDPLTTSNAERKSRGVGSRAISRHRRCEWRERNRARPLRNGHCSGRKVRADFRLYGRRRDGAEHENHACPDRRRAIRRGPLRNQRGRRRHRVCIDGARRICQPPDRERGLVRSHCGKRRAPKGAQRGGRSARRGRRPAFAPGRPRARAGELEIFPSGWEISRARRPAFRVTRFLGTSNRVSSRPRTFFPPALRTAMPAIAWRSRWMRRPAR